MRFRVIIMANRRMLSKSICTSIKLSELKTDQARLLFTWMIPHADDEGRLQGSLKYIKGIVFPMLDHKVSEVETWLSNLSETGLIHWYTVGGGTTLFIEIIDWLKHQTLKSDRVKPSLIPCFNGNGSAWVPKRFQRGDKMESNVIEDKLKEGKINEGKPEPENFVLPPKEDIDESSLPKIKQDIENVTQHLYDLKIFPKVHAFKNKYLKDKNARTVLLALSRCFLKKPEGPWAYCMQILKVEDGNFNEREQVKKSDADKAAPVPEGLKNLIKGIGKEIPK